MLTFKDGLDPARDGYQHAEAHSRACLQPVVHLDADPHLHHKLGPTEADGCIFQSASHSEPKLPPHSHLLLLKPLRGDSAAITHAASSAGANLPELLTVLLQGKPALKQAGA